MSSTNYRMIILLIATAIGSGFILHSRSSAQSSADCATALSPAPIHRVKHPPKTPRVDWTTLASTYSHDASGQRVDQYALPVEPLVHERPDYVKSGYRHTRSSLQAGFSADHYHVTEQWGQGVQPYGQWRYPFRPYSVPYDQWGPQLPQVLGGGFPYYGGGPFVGGDQPGFHGHPGFGHSKNRPHHPAPHPMQPGSSNGGMNNLNSMNGHHTSHGHPTHGHPMHGHPMGGMPGGMNPHWPGSPGFGPEFGPGFGQGAMMPWWNNGPGGNGIQAGPWNALPAAQDEYYQQSPTLRSN